MTSGFLWKRFIHLAVDTMQFNQDYPCKGYAEEWKGKKMREILFRAKRKNWRELPKEEWWAEGYPVKYQPCASKDEWIYGIVPTYASALYIIEIDPETLCQYARLKDNNDNRIWENDIVSCRHEKFQEGDDVEQYLLPDTIKYKRNYAVEFINTGSKYGYRRI